MRFKEEKCPGEVFNHAFLQTWKEIKRPSSSASEPGSLTSLCSELDFTVHLRNDPGEI